MSDIASVEAPVFSDVDEWKKKTNKKLKEVDEDLASFTGTSDETDVDEIMNQIESVMDSATTSKGKERFAEFEGASKGSDLAKLKDYNEDKKEEVMEKSEDAKDSALNDVNKNSSKDVVEQAYTDFKNGDLDYDEYTAILNSVKHTSGNMNEDELEEEATENFINYLNDHDLMEPYLEDHQPVAEYVTDNIPSMLTKYVKGGIPVFLEKLGYDQKQLAEKLMESDEIAEKVAKKNDHKFSEEITKVLKNSDDFYKYAKYLKGFGWILGGAGYAYGGYKDVKENDKSIGQAITHGGTSLAIAVGVGMAINPAGWALAAGIGLTAFFELAYTKNWFSIQDGLDKAGEWVDSSAEAAGDFFKNPGESIASGVDAINPFT